MNTYVQVDQLIDNWQRIGMSQEEIVIATAQACMGWPYVFAARGETCTPSHRKSRARDDHPTIVSKCQVLSGKKSGCAGCRWYPGGNTRCYDCRGFTYWVLLQVGIKIKGAGATSQYDDAANWTAQGTIKEMPRDRVCCLFNKKGNKMEHTGFWLKNDMVIHCSGEVKEGKLRNFTHFAIPKGLYEGGGGEVPTERRPTLRRGSKGDAVKELQTILDRLGYDLGKYGIDSDFGRATKKAVETFQKNAGIGVDGIVGAATWAALDLAVEKEDKADDPDEKRYTVIIPGRTAEQAYLLAEQYPGATMTEE